MFELIGIRDKEGKLHHKRQSPEVEWNSEAKQKLYPRELKIRDLEKPSFHLDMLFEDRSQDVNIETVTLDSKLALQSSVSIFANYLRNDPQMFELAEDPDADLIVIAPLNAAIMSLTKKPWQFPFPIESDGQSPKDQDKAIDSNIECFVRRHLVSYNDQMEYSVGSQAVALPSIYYQQNHNPRNWGHGDVIIKRNDYGEYLVGSNARPDVFQKAESIIYASNGVILLVDTTLAWP